MANLPDLVARFRVDTSGLGRAAAGVRAFGASVGREVGGLNKEVAKTPAAFNALGKAGVAVGAGVAAAFGLSIKAAIDYESAFAGVRKTFDDTGLSSEQAAAKLEEMDQGIRQLARDTPATAVEIAKVAESAGQLGVARDAILSFSETMIQLGETTNLTADEAAVNMARFANIFQTPTNEIDNLGAALVDLGNKGASTEAEILEMATRLAGAGKTAGLAEADVLGFANALSSVGIYAEAGGSAFSKVMISISDAVETGSDDLTTLAEVAGVSAQQFAAAYNEDPAQAITLFIEGLGDMMARGESTSQVLDELGFGGIRVSDALRRLAGAGDLTATSLRNGNDAFEESRALVEEYEKRLDTTGSKLEIARNNIVDLAIRLGDAFLPAVSSAAEGVTDFATGLSDLPGPLKAIGVGATGLVGTVAALGGGFLLMAPRINQAAEAFQRLENTAPRAAGALGVLGKAGAIGAGIAVLATAIDVITSKVQELMDGTTDLSDVQLALLDMAEGGRVAEGAFERLDEAAASSQDSIARYIDELDNMRPDDVRAGQERLRDALKGVDEALAGLVEQGSAEEAEAALTAFAEASGASLRDLLPYLDQYEEALQNGEIAARAGGDGAAVMTEAVGAMTETAEEAEESLKELTDEIERLITGTFGATAAESDFQAAVDELSESTKEYGTTLDLNTQQGRANQAALQSMGETGLGVVQTYAELHGAGAGLNLVIAQQRQRFIDAAVAAGFERGEATKLAEQLFALDGTRATTSIALQSEDAQAKLDHYLASLDRAEGNRFTTVTSLFSQPPPGRAEGGPVTARSPYIIGERGPELFVPSTSGTVVPNSQLGRGGTRDVHYHFTNVKSSAREVSEELDWHRRTAGV